MGREPLLGELARTPAQRRADAAVQMALRSAAMPEGARLPEPAFVVRVDDQTFSGVLCELASGTVVTPGTLVSWAAEGWVQRIVFDGKGRGIDVGPRRRIFDGATREIILSRGDRECYHPYCEKRAVDCQVDHVQPFSEDGLTVQDNGRPACGFHNRLRNRRPQPPRRE